MQPSELAEKLTTLFVEMAKLTGPDAVINALVHAAVERRPVGEAMTDAANAHLSDILSGVNPIMATGAKRGRKPKLQPLPGGIPPPGSGPAARERRSAIGAAEAARCTDPSGCLNDARSKGLCSKHYQAARRRAQPEDTSQAG